LSLLRTIRRDLSDLPVRRSIARILGENVLCSMATIGPRGRAHVNTAYYCFSPDLKLYFLSDPGSRHCMNLARSPSMAIAVFRSSQVWGKPDRGLQLFGTCSEARGADRTAAERLYGRRFPAYAKAMGAASRNTQREAQFRRSYRFYRFVPREVKVLDERVFGGGVFVIAKVPPGRTL